ncbi:MAG TPA: 2-C-methyl-D-erythritol 4-phosphate cytidylyltransferase [Candidatus Saccharimonadales bacterium]|nr:2-C-methyl-D-erythritol 4-phosphate cytidylyltransferase [Candidatus Saccharimonadales bacterium]
MREGAPGASALVPAAGSGDRFGGAKLWADLSGQPVLAWVLQALGDPASGVDELVVVIDPKEHRRVMELASAAAPRLGCRCIEGGSRRQDSVAQGLRLCSREMVLVHDGARPGVTAELCSAVLRAARASGAASACVPVADSTAIVRDGRLVEVLPRAELGAIQTPQAFRRELLIRAHREATAAGHDADDDAALVMALGEPVAVVMGDPRNLKVTRTEDILALRSWLGHEAWARQ